MNFIQKFFEDRKERKRKEKQEQMLLLHLRRKEEEQELFQQQVEKLGDLSMHKASSLVEMLTEEMAGAELWHSKGLSRRRLNPYDIRARLIRQELTRKGDMTTKP